MRNNASDETLKKNYISKYQFLIKEYEEVKAKRHSLYKSVGAFYEAHGTCRQQFRKYYVRYLDSGGLDSSLLPGKRGPRFKTRRFDSSIEDMALELRNRGCNKYEISDILKARLKTTSPSPSGVYNILKRYEKNRLTKSMQEEKRKIIKTMAGEMANIDCHHLGKDTITTDNNRYYLVCVIDACTRIAWAEVTTDIKALSVMFATLHCFNHINNYYNIKFAEALTDNGPEFGPKDSQSKNEHPFTRLLTEMGIKHRHTRPYRPQTNGKVERFWRTLNYDLIDGTFFESIEHFKKELFTFLVYYNNLRPHQSLGGITPQKFAQSCQRIM